MGTPVRAPDPGCRLFFARDRTLTPVRPTPTKPTEEDKRDDSSDEEEEKNAPQIEEEDSDDEDSDDEEPVAKKAKVEGKDKKKKKKKSKGSDDDDSVNSDVVEDLSGDEVDTSNIIEEVEGLGRDGPPFSPTPPPIWPRTPTRTRSPPTWSAFHQFLHSSFSQSPRHGDSSWEDESLRSRASLAARLGRQVGCADRYPPGGFFTRAIRRGSRNPKISGISADVTHRVNS